MLVSRLGATFLNNTLNSSTIGGSNTIDIIFEYKDYMRNLLVHDYISI